MPEILILYYSQHGATAELAQHIAHGVESSGRCSAKLRTVAEVSPEHESSAAAIPPQGPPYAILEDLHTCDGLIVGSPAYFGNMAAPLKYFFDQSSALWLSGAMVNKPGAVFTSSSSMHGGQESVLLSMMLPLLHHGMLMVGLPYTERALNQTQSGGTPYGASHVQQGQNQETSASEKSLCLALGKRVAELTDQLK